MKTLAIILVIAIPSLIGLERVSRLRLKVRALTSLSASIELMRGEICTRLTPLPELMKSLARDAPEPARDFFVRLDSALGELGRLSFSQIWQEALDDSNLLSDDEKNTLGLLGLQLGRYDVKEQESAITLVLSRMESHINEARRQLDSQGALFTGLGITVGLTFAVILI